MKKSLFYVSAIITGLVFSTMFAANAAESGMCLTPTDEASGKNKMFFCLQTDNPALQEEGPIKIGPELVVFYHTVIKFDPKEADPKKVELFAEYINMVNCKTSESQSFIYLISRYGQQTQVLNKEEQAKGLMAAPKIVLGPKTIGGQISEMACNIAKPPKVYKPEVKKPEYNRNLGI